MYLLASSIEEHTGGPANTPLEALNLGSITGIVLATLVIVEILKRAIGDRGWFSRVPVFIYAMVIAAILAVLANKVMKMSDGSPMLEGDLWKVLWSSIISAAGSSGFYTWMRKPQPVAETNRLLTWWLLLPAIGFSIFSGGCQGRSDAEHVTFREGADQATRTIRAEHKQWASMLVVDENGKDQRANLPRLSPFDYNNRMQAHAEYENLVNEDRKRDPDSVPFAGLKEAFGAPKPPPVLKPVAAPIVAPPLARAPKPKAKPKPKPAASQPAATQAS